MNPRHDLLMLLQDLIRISVGIEHIDDIIDDFEQSFNLVKRQGEAGFRARL